MSLAGRVVRCPCWFFVYPTASAQGGEIAKAVLFLHPADEPFTDGAIAQDWTQQQGQGRGHPIDGVGDLLLVEDIENIR